MDNLSVEKLKYSSVEQETDRKCPHMFTSQYPPPPLSKVAPTDCLVPQSATNSADKYKTKIKMNTYKADLDEVSRDQLVKIIPSPVGQSANQVESDEGKFISKIRVAICNASDIHYIACTSLPVVII